MYEKDLAGALANTVVRRGARGFTFEDLVRVASAYGASVSDVADWLANARASGFLDDLGFDEGVDELPMGPRRYRLAPARRMSHAG